MAKVTVKMPDEMLEKLSKLGSKTDEIAHKVLEAGAEVVLKEVKSSLDNVIGQNTKVPSRSTGELQSSLGMSKVGTNKKGDYDIKIGFAEPRSDGESNAKLANLIEHGRHGQVAKPFLKPAQRRSKAPCVEAMKQTFEEEVKKL